jgi:hypothetical protein
MVTISEIPIWSCDVIYRGAFLRVLVIWTGTQEASSTATSPNVSRKGGRPPLDPKSEDPSFRTDITRRFEKDAHAEALLDKTVAVALIAPCAKPQACH